MFVVKSATKINIFFESTKFLTQKMYKSYILVVSNKKD